MGTFGTYTGKMLISEDKREEFTADILKILNYGGMMQFDRTVICGHEITLLKPVEAGPDGRAVFCYNYFEDHIWEEACYHTDSGGFFSGKLGGREFCDVVTAVHFLYELYDSGAGFTQIDGEVIGTELYTGWINHVLGKTFSMKKRFRLWEHFEHYFLERSNPGYQTAEDYPLMETIPFHMYRAMGGIEFSDICYVMEGTDSLQEKDLGEGSYSQTVCRCKKLLERYLTENKNDENKRTEKIWELVKLSRHRRKKIQENGLSEIAQMSLELPARVLVYLTAEIRKYDFWTVWKELYKDIYRDEMMRQYVSDELARMREQEREKPVPPVITAEFFAYDDPLLFWDTPKELEGQPDYRFSDDDRAFWWDENGEVVLSAEMDLWLKNLAVQYQKQLDMIPEENQVNFKEEMVLLLEETEKFYRRIYAFADMFYEFLQNDTDRRYAAAVRQLKILVEENKAAGRIIEKVKPWWEITSRNVTHNKGRLTVKRYLSVMANRKLRKKYFGF